ncbi:MAG: hypothetical protein ACJA1A_002032 [Saprospiraceae bacterium]|jgi:hypothetical protein
MDKAYQGFSKSQLIWKGSAYGMTQFEIPLSSMEITALPPVPTDRRLGHQAEFVFLQLLNACSEYDVLAHSIQLIHDKRTLGELDYIIQNVKTKEVLHIELTYKFYILDTIISNPIDQLIGPNRKDTFVKKLNKTRDKQLPLLYSEPSKIALKELGLEVTNIRQLVAFYAHIFVPYTDRTFRIENLNEDCISGFWVSRDQFSQEVFKNYVYYLPTKTEWLHIPHDEKPWKSYDEVMDVLSSISGDKRSVMLWQREGNESGRGNGIVRVFVC